MPSKGLPWNRSDKESRRKTLDPYDRGRHSEQVPRSQHASEWSASMAKRAASMEDPRRAHKTAGTPKDSTDSGENSNSNSNSNHNSQFLSPNDRPGSSRFNRLKFRRHASDSQLATRAKDLSRDQDIPPVPAVPPTPEIIMTSPNLHVDKPTLTRKRSTFKFSRSTAPTPPAVSAAQEILQADIRPKSENRKSRFPTFRSKGPADELRMLAGSNLQTRTSMDHISSREPIASRQSLSSRSDFVDRTPSGEHTPQDRPNDSPEHQKMNRTFTWGFPRRPRQRASLFPLPHDLPRQQPHTAPASAFGTPRPSTSALDRGTPDNSPRRSRAPVKNELQAALDAAANSPTSAVVASTAASSIPIGAPGILLRNNSNKSSHSVRSSPAIPAHMAMSRARSSTMGSNRSDDSPPTPPFVNGGSGRDSTSTAGRSSLSNMFGLRFRMSDPHSPRQGSSTSNIHPHTPGLASHTNSLSLSRDAISLPDREEGETAIQYLSRVEDIAARSQIPSILSKDRDEFFHAVMRSFMRKFAYFGDPLDMAIRKLLMEIDLPKETQQIDRVLQSFSDRYHECNPGIFPTAGK
jgi:hypothetical protein